MSKAAERSFSLNMTFHIQRGQTVPVWWFKFLLLTTTKMGFLQSSFGSFGLASQDELSDKSSRMEDFVQWRFDYRLVRLVVWVCFGEHFIGRFRRAPLAAASQSLGWSVSDSAIVNYCWVRCYPLVNGPHDEIENGTLCDTLFSRFGIDAIPAYDRWTDTWRQHIPR